MSDITPGPWWNESGVIHAQKDGMPGACVHVARGIESRADAELIAAAPDMLSLLRELEWMRDEWRTQEYCPACLSMKRDGHTRRCKLAAMLRRFENIQEEAVMDPRTVLEPKPRCIEELDRLVCLYLNGNQITRKEDLIGKTVHDVVAGADGSMLILFESGLVASLEIEDLWGTYSIIVSSTPMSFWSLQCLGILTEEERTNLYNFRNQRHNEEWELKKREIELKEYARLKEIYG
jgi:hypothetical protein